MFINVNMNYIQNIGEVALSDLDYARQTLGEYRENPLKERYHIYREAEARSDASWEIMSYACEALNIDTQKLIAVIKAMNRQSKKNNWRCCYSLRDGQIGGLLKGGKVYRAAWSDDNVAYAENRVLP